MSRCEAPVGQDGASHPAEALWSLRRRQADPIGFLTALAARGDFVPFSLAGRPAFLLNRPDYIEEVLVSHASKFAKGPANERAKALLGNGLLTADGVLHSRRRALIQSAFARRCLDGFGEVIVSRAQRLCESWQEFDEIDVSRAMGRLTFGILSKTLFDANVDDLYEEVRRAVRQATASLDALVSLVAPLVTVRPERARLDAVVARMIADAERRERSTGCLLSVLLSHESETGSREQLCDDALTILLAGHETISHALTWTWLLLGAHAPIEARLREELAEVLDGRPPVAADIPRLAYARAVLAESLRLYPPAWVLARRAVEPHRVDAGLLPAGALVLVSQYLIHRDERYFNRPQVFDPGRWISSSMAGRPRMAYFPFGAGGRSCIGEAFAWMEGVLLLATITQRWRLRPLEDAAVAVDPRATLRAKVHVRMRLSGIREAERWERSRGSPDAVDAPKSACLCDATETARSKLVLTTQRRAVIE